MKYRRYATDAVRRHVWPLVALGLFLGASACDRRPEAPSSGAASPASAGPTQTGVASYYAKDLAGKPTASGEPHEPGAMTAASRSLPLGSTAKVTNTENGRSVTVRVNDRGPYARNRVLDVSRKAAQRLGFKHDGVAKVAVQPLNAPPAAEAR